MSDPIEKHRKRIYFKGLYTFKILAVLLVLVSSTELMKAYCGLPHLYTFNTIYNAGNLALTWAFVISGFLVATMLLEEKNRTGSIRVKSFYTRRALRFAPIYLFMIILGFFVLPYLPFFQIPGLSSEVAVNLPAKLGLFALMQPQIEHLYFIQIPYAEPMWCIGATVLFYLIIPHIINGIKSSFWVILSIVFGFIVIREGLYIFSLATPNAELADTLSQLERLLYHTRIDCLAIGALGAILIFGKPSALGEILVNPVTEVIAVCGFLFLIIFGYSTRIINHDVHAIILTILVVNVSSKGESLARVENALSRFLGRTSFAAFAVHQIAIVIVIRLMQYFGGSTFDSLFVNAFLYGAAVVVTFVLAWPLHQFIEKPFLKRRAKHTIVKNKGF